MLAKEIELLPGMPITSPGGRRLEVGEIFVPKHDLTKSRVLPPSFRGLSRKVVVFRDGSIAPLAEVRQRFHSWSSASANTSANTAVQTKISNITNIDAHATSKAKESSTSCE